MTPPTRCKVPIGLEPALRACAVAPGEVLTLAGLPTGLFARPGAALPVRSYFELWRAIRTVSNDPGIGIALARAVRADFTEPYFLAVFSAATLGAAVQLVARYKRILSPEDVDLSVDAAGGEATVTYRWPSGAGPPPQALVDAELAFLTEVARRVAVDSPLRVELATPTLDSPIGHAAYFGCPIQLGMPHNALVLAATDLELPLGTHNPALLRALVPYLWARTPAVDGQVDRVRSAVARRLPGARPTVDAVARDVAMSGRSLQRLLRERGTSFRELLDEVRQEHARRYLDATSFGDAEIAFLLGFGDPASFYRAFRAWTGMTPGRFRQRGPEPGAGSGDFAASASRRSVTLNDATRTETAEPQPGPHNTRTRMP